MKRKFTLLQMLLLVVSAAIAQSGIKEYVQQNTHQILTDNLDTLYDADLEKFGEAISNKRIVMLGEQNHGDAATFLMKGRLIKYLHEKKGFNVLAFESDFIAITEGWGKIEKTKISIDSFIKRNIFPIWTYCQTTEKLFYNYIPQTQNTPAPLQLAGFDCQLHGAFSNKNLKENIQNTLNRLSYANLLKNHVTVVLKYSDSLFLNRISKNKTLYDSLVIAVQAILIADKTRQELTSWEVIVFENLISEAQRLKEYGSKKATNHFYRDRQMAKNIEWLATQKYPNQKIIIWAHNGHIAKNFGYSYDNAKEEKFMLGDFLFKQSVLANELYIAGFTSYSGNSSWATNPKFSGTIAKPKKKSIESWVADQYNFAFIDFAKYNNTGNPEAFSMKGSIVSTVVGDHTPYTHYWTKIFDGVFFIRNMYGCAPATLR
jgi:erythromycin esterase-like protein